MQLNNDEIRSILPHRYPFLLVDRIVDMEPGEYARGIKCVSANEMQFLGHFPQKSVMPGVLILEALAQTGACAILSLPEYQGKIVVFGGVKKCRFRRVVVPGDVLEMSCEITGKKGPVGFGKAVAKVDGEIAVDAEISFAISDAEQPEG
ncbi:MAG: 3-hydroxyacyl-ACP dehydratase FabZ [Clostridiales bacterium]|jgi:3-hydroxyacyl-[acyl-carrier-protein] dehydratase|nr:3-hydroxyacyl-ACP dehydratase FabZ [Clostridiales bacterium]